VHVQGDGAHVVEELGVNGPLAVLPPDGLADDGGAAIGDGLAQGEAALADDAVAEALVGDAAFVGGLGGGGEPALVNAAAVGAVGVGVVGVELDAEAGLEEGAGDPVGARRNRPPVSWRAASARDLTFLVTVLREVTVFMGLWSNGLKELSEFKWLNVSAGIHPLLGRRLQIRRGLASPG